MRLLCFDGGVIPPSFVIVVVVIVPEDLLPLFGQICFFFVKTSQYSFTDYSSISEYHNHKHKALD